MENNRQDIFGTIEEEQQEWRTIKDLGLVIKGGKRYKRRWNFSRIEQTFQFLVDRLLVSHPIRRLVLPHKETFCVSLHIQYFTCIGTTPTFLYSHRGEYILDLCLVTSLAKCSSVSVLIDYLLCLVTSLAEYKL